MSLLLCSQTAFFFYIWMGKKLGLVFFISVYALKCLTGKVDKIIKEKSGLACARQLVCKIINNSFNVVTNFHCFAKVMVTLLKDQ